MSPSEPSERRRLNNLFQNAIKRANETEDRSTQASVDIAKEKTQYFEKIALANAATIALVVSFVGAAHSGADSHSGRLQPACMLCWALVALLLAMISAMLRNWLNPSYVIADYTEQKL